MDRLPTEILELIYLALLPIPPCAFLFQFVYPTRHRIQALERLRLVSKKWNSAVLNTPRLWSYIEVSFAWSNVHPLLERAKSSPLHVRIQVNEINPRIQAILETVWSTAERWDTCVICNAMVSGEPGFLPPISLPNVREVWVAGIRTAGPPTLDAPRIETLVECFGAFVIEDGGLSSLRSWQTGLPATMPEWERFTRITQQSPKLRSLQFRSILYDPTTLENSRFLVSYRP
ncbi:hypothetical protein FS837_002224 [Tulasnella sp. UAMH 9824]|nr:hypothetical protein FS837_002224 [Tulasnella sp. UAMH 9824]